MKTHKNSAMQRQKFFMGELKMLCTVREMLSCLESQVL